MQIAFVVGRLLGIGRGRPGLNEADIQRLLVDALLDAYVDWREDAAAAELAYRRWNEANKAEAFVAYATALDREEDAANRYRAAIADLRLAVSH